MKRIIALALILMLTLTSCSVNFGDHIDVGVPDQSINGGDTDSIPNDAEDADDLESDDKGTDKSEDDTVTGGNEPEDNEGENNGNDVNEPDDNTPSLPEIVHNYEAVITYPTCDQGGYTTYSCTECDHFYISDEVLPLGHAYDATVFASGCESGGYTTYICAICSDFYIANETAPLGHSYKSVVTPPSCDNIGYTTYICYECGDSYVSNEVASHGHSYDSVVTSPTCEDAGYTTYTCTECLDTYIADRVSALGHSYKASVTAPTCLDSGYTTYTCLVCGDFYITNQVASKGHSYKSTVISPTCTADGYSLYTCLICGDAYTAYFVEATGHNWKPATTEAPKTCTTCGTTEGEKLPSTTYNDILYVNYIDVGQGDCIFIKVGDCDILIDAGTSTYGSTVSNYLKSKGVDDIELMINTHPDNDHYGGLPQVLKDFVVEDIWVSSYAKSNSEYNNFKSMVRKEGLTMKTPAVGTIYTYEYMTLTVIYAGEGATNSNDSSIVVMLQYGSCRFLFTGDIGSTIEERLASDSNINLSCDVMKVAHHGSKNSSSLNFLKATGAKYGVICVGDNNYGHPTSTALNNLSKAGISVYRTDNDGNVVFSTNGSNLRLPGNDGTVSASSGYSSVTSSPSTDNFIGNKESKIFHLPTCSNLPDVSKRNYLYNYWFIINCIGYTPCKICMKNYEP